MTATTGVLRAAHERCGGVYEDVGAVRPAWYGSDAATSAETEYAAARERVALTDLSDRGVLVVTGPLRVKFLQNILSNDVASLAAGQGRLAALMDIKGHLVVLLRALVGPDEVRLEMPADRLETVERTLVHYRVAAPVRFARADDLVLGLLGPGAPRLIEGLGIAAPSGGELHAVAEVGGSPVRVVRAGDFPADGFAVHVPKEGAGPVWEALRAAGALPLGQRVLDVLRVEGGRPWYGPDVTEANLLHETGLVSEYHSPTKGCYVGQEVIARLEARGGNVNKLLRRLHLEAPSAVGTSLVAEEREVGRLTTVGVSPRLGPVAFGFVHRGHAAPGTRLEAAGVGAVVHPLTPA